MKLRIGYTPKFGRIFKKLEPAFLGEALKKTELLGEKSNHKTLEAHKLRGRLKRRYSFSVNYKYRIVFVYTNRNEVILLAIGDHSVYDE